jgi:hypothetical protein
MRSRARRAALRSAVSSPVRVATAVRTWPCGSSSPARSVRRLPRAFALSAARAPAIPLHHAAPRNRGDHRGAAGENLGVPVRAAVWRRPTRRVRQLADQQRERLGVARDPKRPGIQRVEAHLLDQRGSNLLRARIIAAVEKTRPSALAAGLIDCDSTSLGTVLNAATTLASGRRRASSSAPDVFSMASSSDTSTRRDRAGAVV